VSVLCQTFDDSVSRMRSAIAKGRGQKGKIDGSRFQYLARVKSRLGELGKQNRVSNTLESASKSLATVSRLADSLPVLPENESCEQH